MSGDKMPNVANGFWSNAKFSYFKLLAGILNRLEVSKVKMSNTVMLHITVSLPKIDFSVIFR